MALIQGFNDNGWDLCALITWGLTYYMPMVKEHNVLGHKAGSVL